MVFSDVYSIRLESPLVKHTSDPIQRTSLLPPDEHFFYVSLIHFKICLATIAVKILSLVLMRKESSSGEIWSSMLHLCAKELNAILIGWMECAKNILKPIKGSINRLMIMPVFLLWLPEILSRSSENYPNSQLENRGQGGVFKKCCQVKIYNL